MILKPVVRFETSVRVEGTENLDDLKGPFVMVTNHSSHLDAPLIVTALPYHATKNLAVAAAADYFYEKWWVKALTSLFFNSYPVYRNVAGMGRGNSLSLRLLSDGVPIVIFPEGTRARDGSMKRFKPGAAALCIDQNVPCVPVAIHGTYEAMPVGRFWPVSGRPPVELFIGEPIYPRSGESIREFIARVESRVSTMLTMRAPDIAAESADDSETTVDTPNGDRSSDHEPGNINSAEGEAS
jgi:1-acyl-sn-glycerol-3-phosphate acyltransferase